MLISYDAKESVADVATGSNLTDEQHSELKPLKAQRTVERIT